MTPTARSTADTRSTARPRPLGGALPNLVLIGAQKCGTTSLHRYLDLHPEISMSRPKELNFFLHSPPFGNWPRGLEWYARHFDATAPVRGESSVNYTNLPRSARAAERMHGVIPGAKLIYMVRDPIERTVSHYLHARGLGYESRQITEALRDLDSEFVGRSRYHMQLAEFLRYYPPSSVLVAAQEDLLHRRAETLRRIFAFLGVEESFRSPKFERMWEVSRGKDRKYMLAYQASRRVGKRRWARLPTGLRWVVERVAYFPVWGGIRRPELEEPLRGELAACLQEDAERLRALTGQRFEEWSV